MMEEPLQVPLHFLKCCLNHRMVEVGGDLGGHLVGAPCSARATLSLLSRTVSRQLLNISEGGDSTTALGKLCQCLVTPAVKKWFLMFRGNLPCFSWCPLPLVLALGTTKRSLAPTPLHPPLRYLYTLIRSAPEPSLLQAQQSQLSQPFLICQMLQPLCHLCGPLLGPLQYVHVSLVLRSPELDTGARCGLASAE